MKNKKRSGVVNKAFIALMTLIIVVFAVSAIPTYDYFKTSGKTDNSFTRAYREKNYNHTIRPLSIVSGDTELYAKYTAHSFDYLKGKGYVFVTVDVALSKDNVLLVNDGAPIKGQTNSSNLTDETVGDFTYLELLNGYNFCLGHQNPDGSYPYQDPIEGSVYETVKTSACRVLTYEEVVKTTYNSFTNFFTTITETEEDKIKTVLDKLVEMSSSKVVIYNPSNEVVEAINSDEKYAKLQRTYSEEESYKLLRRVALGTAKFHKVSHPIVIITDEMDLGFLVGNKEITTAKFIEKLHKLGVACIYDMSNVDTLESATNATNKELMDRLLRVQVDGIITNRPGLISDVSNVINKELLEEYNKTTTTTTKTTTTTTTTTTKAE